MIYIGVYKNLVGKRFGRLTVIQKSDDFYISPKGTKFIKWVCLCDCGNVIVTTGNSLKQGHTKSCGCLNNEKRSLLGKSSKRYNQYDLSGKYGVGWTNNTNEEFYFDLEDYDKIKDYCWFLDNRGYILANTFNSKKHKMVQMHRLLMNYPKNKDVDHINHNTKDNRKSNLRICFHRDNQKNLKLSIDNTSGVTGVSWDKNKNNWIVQIQCNNNPIYLGRYIDFKDAVKARKEAEKIYFGEYSYDESMKKANELGIPIISEGEFVQMITS